MVGVARRGLRWPEAPPAAAAAGREDAAGGSRLASPRGEGVVAGAVLSLQGRDGAGGSRVAAAGVKAGGRPPGWQIWF